MTDKQALIEAGRVPRHLLPWNVGGTYNAGIFLDTAHMWNVCMDGLHLVDAPGEGLGGYCVMSDNDKELERHIPAVLAASGRILKTGLGMGCFIRMCLSLGEVEHIDVVEIRKDIIDHFGAEFKDDERVTIHHADAFDFDLSHGPWDFVWHDIYCEGNYGLQELHAKLIKRFAPVSALQGAWAFPDDLAVSSNVPILQHGVVL